MRENSRKVIYKTGPAKELETYLSKKYDSKIKSTK